MQEEGFIPDESIAETNTDESLKASKKFPEDSGCSVDQQMADEYGFTHQRARQMGLYL